MFYFQLICKLKLFRQIGKNNFKVPYSSGYIWMYLYVGTYEYSKEITVLLVLLILNSNKIQTF